MKSLDFLYNMPNLNYKISKLYGLLNEIDVAILKSLYDHRCLTAYQITSLHYPNHKNSNYVKKRIKFFITNSILEEKKSPLFETCYFLTNLGVNIVKFAYNLPNTKYDSNRNIITKGCFTAGELRLKDKYINHQLYVNQFFIDIYKLNIQSYAKYYDSKFAEKFTHVIPDGLLEAFGLTFFIEMDMGTESKKQLFQKWQNYRDFLRSSDYRYSERRIIVLFILENCHNVDNRRKIVEDQAYTVLNGEIDSDFDIYIGSRQEILQLFENKLMPMFMGNYILPDKLKDLFLNKFNFKIASAYTYTNELFSGVEYMYIVKDCTNLNDSKKLIIDDGIFSPFQLLNKISNFSYTNKTTSPLVMVCDSVESMYIRLKQFDLLTQQNIYYTTIERLESKSYFYEALFKFDNMGNVYSFNDSSLSNLVYESSFKN